MSATANDTKSGPPKPFEAAWPWILCLIGLDYFSTLAYQPSIAYQAAGPLAPLAMTLIVVITIFCAVPVYGYVARWSVRGQGSIGMLERLVPGWTGKLLVLILLGFAATNFIFSRTFSAADAAVHLIQNPNPQWQRALDHIWTAGDARSASDHPVWQRIWDYWDRQMVATLLLLVVGFIFWAVFWRGFTKRVVQLAAVVVAVYLTLNAVVIVSGLVYLGDNFHVVQEWWANARENNGTSLSFPLNGTFWMMAAACLLVLPKMALGLSGFELSMVAMPLIRSAANDASDFPTGRVRNTRKMLRAAAAIMAVYLLGATMVTTTLIPAHALAPGGDAADRSLAYLAHGGTLAIGTSAKDINPMFGELFGTTYDAATIVILSLAGAAVTIALRDLVPPYLHRLGMELPWASAIGAILYLFNLTKLVVTVVFHASLNAQRGAYATSVLMLFASASMAAMLAARRLDSSPTRSFWMTYLSAFSAVVFTVLAGAVMIARPEGALVALVLVAVVLGVSMVSRAIRTSELRFSGFEFVDDRSKFLWQSLVYLDFPVMVPHRPGHRSIADKEAEIRARHRLTPEIPVVFVEATLGDPSEFYQLPLVEAHQDDGRFVLRVTRCASIPHALAAVALELSKVGDPPEIHFGWSDENPIAANLKFVLFGQGNVPWMVRALIRRAEPRPERQPQVIIG